MNEGTDKPKLRRRRKRVLSRRVMISTNESINSALELVADESGGPLSEVGLWVIWSGFKAAERDL